MRIEPSKWKINIGELCLTSICLAFLTLRSVGAQPIQRANDAQMVSTIHLMVGKSSVLKLPTSVFRLSIANPSIADAIPIKPHEVYLLGKKPGETNMTIWSKSGSVVVIDVKISIDTAQLQSRMHELLPFENNIQVSSVGPSIILSGVVSDTIAMRHALDIANAFVGGSNPPSDYGQNRENSNHPAGNLPGQYLAGNSTQPGQANAGRVINLLHVMAPQQVMLEVKVAEVAKTLLDKLGAEFRTSGTSGTVTTSLISSFLTNSSGLLGIIKGPNKGLVLDAENTHGLVKILAEPNIMAISGQEASFLAGGKLFLPVTSNPNNNGTTQVTLQEEDFGVKLRFTPTVLSGGRINLRVAPEVSEVAQTGTVISATNAVTDSKTSSLTNILPTITTRQAATTVQLYDGQSFAIGGLIRNDVNETIRAFPGLGSLPILGALFRSSEFQHDKTELLFVVTPHLVKPLPPNYRLPTDDYIQPSPGEFFLNGQMEGKPPAVIVPTAPSLELNPAVPAAPRPAAPAPATPVAAATTASPIVSPVVKAQSIDQANGFLMK